MDPTYSLLANGVGNTKLVAVLGDLQHKIAVYIHCGTPDIVQANRFITTHARAEYLFLHEPDCVPDPDPQGNPPSDKTLSHIFCGLFFADPEFVRKYHNWLSSFPFIDTTLRQHSSGSSPPS